MAKNNDNKITVAIGDNFSGRSEYLKAACENEGIYIGEIPSNYLSGVAPTVKDELQLFSTKSSSETKGGINELLLKLNFKNLFERNPFLLSGGEQVMLTIISSILCEPKLIAIDTAIEQLSMEWKQYLFSLINTSLKQQNFLLSDNRIKEYGISYDKLKCTEIKKDYEFTFLPPTLIEIDNEIQTRSISIRNLWFGYQKLNPILKNINLDLEPENIYFLQGINGAGKSTLAKILSGILRIKKGEIEVNNKPYNTYKIPGKLFGYSFQNPDEQLFSRTVSNEVLSSIKHERENYSKRREIFLKMFGLEKLGNIHPADLPFVIRKRVALAATLANDRPWYIIDEPTIGQDDKFIDFLVLLFKHLASIGKGIVIISHSTAFISRFKSNNLYLDNGLITN